MSVVRAIAPVIRKSGVANWRMIFGGAWHCHARTSGSRLVGWFYIIRQFRNAGKVIVFCRDQDFFILSLHTLGAIFLASLPINPLDIINN